MKKIIKLSVYFSLFVTTFSYAEVVTDGTVGNVRSLSGDMIIRQNLGSLVGNNLFHSFKTFNIKVGESATFKGVNTIKNVISRVTGGEVSTINDLLQSKVGHANFYFINPAGVTFGKGAEINVPAAFHVSTAQKLNFGSDFFDTAIGAVSPPPSTLTIAEPTSFGFLGTSNNNNGLIKVDNSALAIKTGKTGDLVAGNISINNATLSAPAGEIRLVAMQGSGNVRLTKNHKGILPLPIAAPTVANAGTIKIAVPENKEVGNIDTSGNGGGRIALWGGKMAFTNSNLYADNTGDKDAIAAKGVDIRAYSLNLNSSIISFDTYSNDSPNIEGNSAAAKVKVETTDFLKINKNSSIKANAYTDGDAANVKVKAGFLTIDGQNSSKLTGIYSQANNESGEVKGNAGTVKVSAKTLTILNSGLIFSSTATQGNAGNVLVTANNLTIDGKNLPELTTGIFSDANIDSVDGNAGNVTVHAKHGTVNILNGGSIASSTFSQGNAGKVLVTANALNINGNGSTVTGIKSQTDSRYSGQAGNVRVQAKTIDIRNGGDVSSSSFSQGNAGKVLVTADTLTIDGQGSAVTGIKSQTDSRYSGQAGNVRVQAKTIDIRKGGRVSSSTFSKGDAGNVWVTTDNLTINANAFSKWGTGIFSQANSKSIGNAGNLTIKAKKLDIFKGGNISSSTYVDDLTVESKGGDILVTTDFLTINGKGLSSSNTGIFSQANLNKFTSGSTGKAGNVTINAQTIDLINAGVISSSTFGQENSGDVSVTTNNLTIDGQNFSAKPTGIFSQTDNDLGNAGVVSVKADTVDIIRGGAISSSTLGGGNAGNVNLETQELLLDDNSKISALAEKGSSGQTGNVTVIASKSLQLANQAKITIQNNAWIAKRNNITSGLITISAPDIDLKNSSITAESTGNIDAGSINVKFLHQLAMLDNSLITTTAKNGNGGAIDINDGELINLQNSGFLTSVTGKNGNGGDINVAADIVLMDTGLIQANAVAGKGGNINLNLKALIPSYDTLIKGGSQVLWQPHIAGFNVIQAASATGVSGNINLASPQFNISGVISGLSTKVLPPPDINRNPCQNSTLASSLARKSKGGLPSTDKQAVFFPSADLPATQTTPTAETENLNLLQNFSSQPCAAL